MIFVWGCIARRFVIFAVFSCFMGLLAHPSANGSEVTDFWLGTKFDAGSRKNRIDVAKEMLKDFRQFRNYLPIQKPTELDWIKAEQEAVKGIKNREAMESRLSGLLGSVEFNHMTIGNLAQAIDDALECAASSQVALSREMFCWSVASFNITESSWGEGIPLLIKSRRLSKDVETPGKLIGLFHPGSVFFDKAGRSILELIVIPYLGGTIQE